MVLLQDFVSFWGRNITVNKLNPYDFKEENEKTFFCVEKYVNSLRKKKIVIKKKTKKLFLCGKNRFYPLRKKT